MTISQSGTKSGSGRIWWVAASVLVSAWFLYLFFFGPRSPLAPPLLDGSARILPAEYDWQLHDLDGRPVPFSQYRGKTVFLNVWATWCPPCVAELPAIANLARSPGLDGVAFVCVSTDEDPAALKRFVEGKDWPMTILRANDLPHAFTTEGIPATFLIAADGRIAASGVGAAQWDDRSVVEFLGRLASEAKPKPDP